jgi:biotin carboxylase
MPADRRPALLVVSAGIMQIPALKTARDLGCHVVASDRNPEAAGFALADERLVIDVKDVEGHVRWARENAARVNLRGAFAGADVAVTVAAVCAAAGLPGIPVEVAELSNHKGKMKRRWLRDGVPTPWSEEVATLAEARRALAHAGLPAMVKAVDSAASRGSRMIRTEDELAAAYAAACAVSRSATALVEQRVAGREYSAETIVWRGVHRHVSLADRHFGFSPYAIETAHVDPSHDDGERQRRIYEVVDAAAESLGIDFGPAKADMIWTERGPMVLELPARLSGGFHSQYTTPLSTGKDPIRAVMKLALGEPLDEDLLASRWDRTSICAGIFPPPGVLRAIAGVDEALRLPGIAEVIVTRKPGETIEPYVDNAKRCCWVIAVADDEAQAWRRVEAARRTIAFDVAPAAVGAGGAR